MLIDKKIIWLAGILVVGIVVYFTVFKSKEQTTKEKNNGELNPEEFIADPSQIRHTYLKKVV